MEENNLKTKKDLKKNISKNKEFEFIIKGQIPIKKIISKSNKNSTNNSSSRTNSKSNPRNSIILTKIKNENNNLNKIEFCKDKELFSDNSLSNEDLLIVIGCNNNNNNNKKELKKSLSSSYLKNVRIINEKFKNFHHKNNYTSKSFSKKKNEENEIMKEKILYKPLKIAGTIYKKLCQKKLFFIDKIKEKQEILKGEKTDIQKTKNQNLNKSNIILKKNLSVTNYLNQKILEKIPITFPLNLSYKNSYESQSEKYRQEKIIDKFIQLKTYIKRQPENEKMIIQEFLIKNGFEDIKYFSPDKINNLSYFLNHPFNFDSKKRIKDIINEALNYKPTNEEIISDQNKLKEVNFFLNGENKKIEIHNYSPQYYKKIKAFPKTSYHKKKSFFDTINQEKLYENLCKYEQNHKSLSKYEQNHKSLNEMILSLEAEFKQLNNEKQSINEKTNNILNNENPINKQIEDKNKLVPNLCLSYKGFSKLNMNKINQNNKMLKNIKNKKEKIKEINDRLYYNFIQNSNDSFDIEKIKRRHKLTEYIILKRAKYKALIDSKKEKLDIIPFID